MFSSVLLTSNHSPTGSYNLQSLKNLQVFIHSNVQIALRIM